MASAVSGVLCAHEPLPASLERRGVRRYRPGPVVHTARLLPRKEIGEQREAAPTFSASGRDKGRVPATWSVCPVTSLRVSGHRLQRCKLLIPGSEHALVAN